MGREIPATDKFLRLRREKRRRSRGDGTRGPRTSSYVAAAAEVADSAGTISIWEASPWTASGRPPQRPTVASGATSGFTGGRMSRLLVVTLVFLPIFMLVLFLLGGFNLEGNVPGSTSADASNADGAALCHSPTWWSSWTIKMGWMHCWQCVCSSMLLCGLCAASSVNLSADGRDQKGQTISRLRRAASGGACDGPPPLPDMGNDSM